MYHGSFKHAQKKIVPEALYLHVLRGHYSKINKHVKPHGKLDEVSGILHFPGVKQYSQTQTGADISEVIKIKCVVKRQP